MQFFVHTIFLLYYKYIKFVFLRARRKSFSEWFGISALGESRFPNGLMFPRMAKVISRRVWSFRAWRKSFPEWFGISALGESHFPNGLMFPRMAKVVSRMVWSFRAWRKSFPKWICCLRASRKSLFKGFGTCGPPANDFLDGEGWF